MIRELKAEGVERAQLARESRFDCRWFPLASSVFAQSMPRLSSAAR